MAGDWIKMRVCLARSPKTLRVAHALGVPKATVLGGLFLLWCLADEQTTTGALNGVTFALVDTEVGISGFSAALAHPDVDWLRETPAGVVFPRWGKHNGSTAKARASNAKRAAKYRGLSRHGTVTVPSRSERDASATGALPRARASKEQEAEKTEQQASKSPVAREPVAVPIAEEARLRALCSLLLAGIPAMTPRAAAAIVRRRGVTEALVTWAVERTRNECRLREGGPDPVKNPVGYCRRLIENEQPPPGWTEQFTRRRLSAMRDGVQSPPS